MLLPRDRLLTPQTKQLQRSLCTLARRDVDMRQILRHDQAVVAYQCLARGSDTFLTVGREGNVGDTGMSTVEGPFSLALRTSQQTPCKMEVCFDLTWRIMNTRGVVMVMTKSLYDARGLA